MQIQFGIKRELKLISGELCFVKHWIIYEQNEKPFHLIIIIIYYATISLILFEICIKCSVRYLLKLWVIKLYKIICCLLLYSQHSRKNATSKIFAVWNEKYYDKVGKPICKPRKLYLWIIKNIMCNKVVNNSLNCNISKNCQRHRQRNTYGVKYLCEMHVKQQVNRNRIPQIRSFC